MNIKVGDTVKVTGKTTVGSQEDFEAIKIGTICEVTDIHIDEKEKVIELVPLNKKDDYWYGGWWYSIKDVEKGHLEWIPEKD